MPETFTDHLTSARDRFARTLEQIRDGGLEDGDLASAIQYLLDLEEHAVDVASVALEAVETWPDDHPLKGTPGGYDAEENLAHAKAVCDAASAFIVRTRDVLARLAI